MSNKNIFGSATTTAPVATGTNAHNKVAYLRPAAEALRLYAFTSCLNGTAYSDGETQLAEVIKFADQCSAKEIADIAVEARINGKMKDVPPLLLAYLTSKKEDAYRNELRRVFNLVVDNGKVLKNYVQIVRSGVFGFKSLGSTAKNLVKDFINARSDEQLLWDSIGKEPSLGDVIALAHPRPENSERANLYSYFMKKDYDSGILPEKLVQLEDFRSGKTSKLPNVPFQLLEGLPNLTSAHWRELAMKLSWDQLRQKLNVLQRNGVFDDQEMVKYVSEKLKDRKLILSSGAQAYSLFTTYLNTTTLPNAIRDSLYEAAEIAVENMPLINGKVVIALDVSGSMRTPITGTRPGSTSSVTCQMGAAFFASAIARKNPAAEVIVFSDQIHSCSFTGRDSILTNAQKLSSIKGGGTNCSLPLLEIQKRNMNPDVVIMLSDYESWADLPPARGRTGTPMGQIWTEYLKAHPKTKMICVDMAPRPTTQAVRKNTLNIGGLSERVFFTINNWLEGVN